MKLLSSGTLLCLLVSRAQPSLAQYEFTDSNLSPYVQHFDAMSGNVAFSGGTTAAPELKGVYAAVQADPQYGNGSFYPNTIAANDGATVMGNFYHFGYPGDTDRAFGGIAETGSYTGTGYVGIRLRNSTSVNIQNLEIQYAMEQWYNSGNAAAAYVHVSYRKRSGIEGEDFGSLSSVAVGNAWTTVPALTVEAPSTGTVIQSRDGNSPSNRRVAQTILTDLNLAAGEEIMIRWDYVLNHNTNGNGVSIDDVVITPETNTLFTDGGSNVTWQDEHGTAPASLSAPNQTYYVAGTVTAADLADISGTNSKVIIGTPAQNGEPAQAGELVLTDNTALSVPVDVSAGSTLRIEEGAAAAVISIGTLAPGSTVVYAGNTGTQTIRPASYGNLTLEGAGPKVLGQDVLVNGNLALDDARLSLGTHDVTITKGGQVLGAGASAYVVADNSGRLRQSVLSNNLPVVFPVGTATRYLPLTLRQSLTRSEDVFSVRVSNDKYSTYNAADAGIGSPAEVTKGVRKTWFVSEEVKGNASVTMQLQWQAADQSADFEPTKAYVSHFRNGFWDRTTTSIGAVPTAPDTYTLSRANITTFSPFTISSDPAQPLPVELVSFEARRVGNVVSCIWATASEKNNHHFDLQRSLDGQTYRVIGTLAGAGTTSGYQAYALADKQPASGTAYYRLSQVDANGNSAYSPVVAVSGGSTKVVPLTAAPNPSTGPVALHIATPDGGLVRGTVINTLGREVLRFAQPADAGMSTIQLNLEAQPAGLYLVQVQTPQGVQTLRVMKL
jgi:hypothetical protein